MEGQGVAAHQKKGRRLKAWIFFQDESGVSQRPPVRCTWAPKGQTPVLVHPFNWKKLSICAALGYHWNGKRSELYFQTRPGSYDTPTLVEFLEDFRKEIRGRRKVILIWDGLPAHKSWQMQEYIREQSGWLHVERLPGYAPDLNPVEALWGNVKGGELANRCVDGLDEMKRAVRSGLRRVGRSPSLALSFLEHAGLSF